MFSFEAVLECLEHLRLHALAYGQPTHLTPRFFSLIKYHITPPAIKTNTAMIITSSIIINPYLLKFFKAASALSFLLVFKIITVTAAAIARTNARPIIAATTFKDAGEAINVPIV